MQDFISNLPEIPVELQWIIVVVGAVLFILMAVAFIIILKMGWEVSNNREDIQIHKDAAKALGEEVDQYKQECRTARAKVSELEVALTKCQKDLEEAIGDNAIDVEGKIAAIKKLIASANTENTKATIVVDKLIAELAKPNKFAGCQKQNES